MSVDRLQLIKATLTRPTIMAGMQHDKITPTIPLPARQAEECSVHTASHADQSNKGICEEDGTLEAWRFLAQLGLVAVGKLYRLGGASNRSNCFCIASPSKK